MNLLRFIITHCVDSGYSFRVLTGSYLCKEMRIRPISVAINKNKNVSAA